MYLDIKFSLVGKDIINNCTFHTHTSFHGHNIIVAISAHYSGNYFYSMSNKNTTIKKLEV